MAKLVDLYRSDTTLNRRQLPLSIDDNLTMVMDLNSMGLICDNKNVRGKELEDVTEKLKLLTADETKEALRVNISDIQRVLNEGVPCVGCRRSVERLFFQIMSAGYPTLDPIIIDADYECLTVRADKIRNAQVLCNLFHGHTQALSKLVDNQPRSKKSRRCMLHSLDSQRSRLMTSAWKEVWDCMRPTCKEEIVLIESSLLQATLETYLRKHRFCMECRTKVLRAFALLVEEHDLSQEKGYSAKVYAGIKRCFPDKHLHLQTKTDYISNLIEKAEPEIMGSRRERHAKTLEIAQEEVLTCLGICVYERLHRVYMRLREEECTCQILAAVAADCLCRNFETAVEVGRGISQLELLYEELTREEQLQQLKKEQRKLKKRLKKALKKELQMMTPDEKETDGIDEIDDLGSVESLLVHVSSIESLSNIDELRANDCSCVKADADAANDTNNNTNNEKNVAKPKVKKLKKNKNKHTSVHEAITLTDTSTASAKSKQPVVTSCTGTTGAVTNKATKTKRGVDVRVDDESSDDACATTTANNHDYHSETMTVGLCQCDVGGAGDARDTGGKRNKKAKNKDAKKVVSSVAKNNGVTTKATKNKAYSNATTIDAALIKNRGIEGVIMNKGSTGSWSSTSENSHDCGYSSEHTTPFCCDTASISSQTPSSADNSDVACSDGYCDHDANDNGTVEYCHRVNRSRSVTDLPQHTTTTTASTYTSAHCHAKNKRIGGAKVANADAFGTTSLQQMLDACSSEDDVNEGEKDEKKAANTRRNNKNRGNNNKKKVAAEKAVGPTSNKHSSTATVGATPLSPTGADAGGYIPVEEVIAFKSKMSQLNEQRQQLRVTLKERFARMCKDINQTNQPRFVYRESVSK